MNNISTTISTPTTNLQAARANGGAAIIGGADELAQRIRSGVQGGTITLAQSEWYKRPADERFETLEALYEATSTRRRNSRAYDIDASALRAVPNELETRGMTLQAGNVPLDFTHWSFGQTCSRVGAPASYLRTLPAPLAAQCLDNGFGALAAADRGAKLLTVANDETDEIKLQAITSPDYGRIWDADVAQLAMRLRDRSNGALHNPLDWKKRPSGLYASDHDCFVLMIDGGSIVEGGSDRDQLHRGVLLANSETGAKGFWMLCFLFRACCGNHLITGAQNIEGLILRHTKNGPARFESEGWPSLEAWLHSSAQPLEDQVRRAKDFLLPEPTADDDETKVLWQFARKVDPAFSRTEIRDGIRFAKAEEGDCRTLWQLTNGLTAAARAIEWIDERVLAEKRAGKLFELASSTRN